VKKTWIGIALVSLASSVWAQDYAAVKIEAEGFASKNNNWYLTSINSTPNVRPDPDGSHASSASGGAYLELLPDTRVTHGDPLNGSNFWNAAGAGPRISYRVNFPEPGRYFVYVRAYSTGTEDNGIHVGINGSWPASGARMQWCSGKNSWTWSSAQRVNSNHCGVQRAIYLDVPSAGTHSVNFSAREDGFEFDSAMFVKEKTGKACTVSGTGSVNCGPGGSGSVVDGGSGSSGNSGGEVVMGLYDSQTDLISLQYDFGPDPDDAHAAAAGRHLTSVLGIEPMVVFGAIGDGIRSGFRSNARPVMDKAWGTNRYIDLGRNWQAGVKYAAEEWGTVIARGGKVFVAEGGQSDFSADVIRELKKGQNIRKSDIVIVQHSAWNEKNANQNDLRYVKQNTNYLYIDNGNNGGNRTADLNEKSNVFVNAVKGMPGWKAAFDYLDPVSKKLDFSDTVELLYILGIGLDQVSDLGDAQW